MLSAPGSHPIVGGNDVTPIIKSTKTCLYCDQEFHPRGGQDFCSLSCRDHDRQRRSPECVCQECGGKFKRFSYKVNLYCSKKCSMTALMRTRKPRAKKPPNLIHAVCLNCAKYFTKQRSVYIGPSKNNTPKFCSQRCSGIYRRGPRNVFFLGGSLKPPRYFGWRTKAALTRERDHHQCVVCGSSTAIAGDEKRKLNVDHIVPERLIRNLPWEANRHGLWNLVTLCNSCHAKKTAVEKHLFYGKYQEFIDQLKAFGYPVRLAIDAMSMVGLEFGSLVW